MRTAREADLSALADGELDADGVAPRLRALGAATPTRAQTWHAYHLIGDVLRSDDLASRRRARRGLPEPPARSAWPTEPVVLAPQPPTAAAAAAPALAGRRAWRALARRRPSPPGSSPWPVCWS